MGYDGEGGAAMEEVQQFRDLIKSVAFLVVSVTPPRCDIVGMDIRNPTTFKDKSLLGGGGVRGRDHRLGGHPIFPLSCPCGGHRHW